VCTPSRYGILTGRYAWRGRLQRSVLWPHARPLIERNRITLPQFLQAQGYHTGCVGKWHLGMDWPFQERCETDDIGPRDHARIIAHSRAIDYTQPIRHGPNAYGFEYYFGVDVPNFPPYCFIENNRTLGIPDRLKPDDMFGLPGLMIEGWDLEAIMPTLTDECVAYIHERAEDKRPFFLYFPMTAPHTPIAPIPAFQGSSDAGEYGDFVTQLDDSIGQINAALEATGLAEDTLVIVTSDNGSPGRSGSLEAPGTVVETYGHNPSWILRGMKADAWDGGHRVPYIAKWPGHIPTGSRCDELVCLMDLMATCADLLEHRLPSDTAEDSLSILPYLLGQEVSHPIREVLVHHGSSGLHGIRRGDWKFIAGTGSGGFSPNPDVGIYDPPGQLYNMHTDIRERHNVYGQQPAKVTELARLLLQYRSGAHRP
jgi:arylsulfatase A-like enzyme